MIAPANTERVTSLEHVQVHTLKKTPSQMDKQQPNIPPKQQNHITRSPQQSPSLQTPRNLVPGFPFLHVLILMNFPINNISILHWQQTVLQNKTLSVLISNGTMKLIVQLISQLLFVEVCTTALSRSSQEVHLECILLHSPDVTGRPNDRLLSAI